MKNQNLIVKNVALATVVLTAATLLAGCGSTVSFNNFVIPEGGLTTEPITIDFYSTMGQNLQNVFNAAVSAFNADYPNVKVNHVPVGGYDDLRNQISTELATGNGPDLAYCYPDHVALYNKTGAVVPLDDLMNHGEYGVDKAVVEDFVPGYLEEGRSYGDNRMYTLPFSKSTEVLYYNKTFFDKHNLKVPTTWDEMETVARQIKQIDPASTPLGYDSESNWFITLAEQYESPYTTANEPYFLFDNATNRAFVKRIRGWFKEGLVTTQEIYGAYTSGLFTNVGEGNKSYMSIGSSAGATYQRPAKLADGSYPFEVGIAVLPQVNPNKPKVISQGPPLCLLSTSENPQETLAAWLLMRYMTTTVSFQAQFSSTSGYVPVLQSVPEVPAYAELLNKADGYDNVAFLSAKTCVENLETQFTSPAFVGSSAAREEVGILIQTVLAAPVTADDDQVIDQAFKKAISNCKLSV